VIAGGYSVTSSALVAGYLTTDGPTADSSGWLVIWDNTAGPNERLTVTATCE
jgi:hypothetical protein